MKLAAIEAMWETEPAPASFTAFGFPDVAERTTHFAIHIPWVLGLIAHALARRRVPGINELVDDAEQRIASGIDGLHGAADAAREPRRRRGARGRSTRTRRISATRCCCCKHVDDPRARDAGDRSRPRPPARSRTCRCCSGAFRIMVGSACIFIALFAYVVLARRRDSELERHRWFLRVALCSLPLPWLAIELGWIVAEYGRQPWAIEGVLPTSLGVSR